MADEGLGMLEAFFMPGAASSFGTPSSGSLTASLLCFVTNSTSLKACDVLQAFVLLS